MGRNKNSVSKTSAGPKNAIPIIELILLLFIFSCVTLQLSVYPFCRFIQFALCFFAAERNALKCLLERGAYLRINRCLGTGVPVITELLIKMTVIFVLGENVYLVVCSISLGQALCKLIEEKSAFLIAHPFYKLCGSFDVLCL